MTTKDEVRSTVEALKMALEALEFIRRWGEPEEGVLKRDEAITAIREALTEQPRLLSAAPCDQCGYNGPGYYQPDTHQCAAKHHKALADESSGTEQLGNHYDDVRESMRQAFEQSAQQQDLPDLIAGALGVSRGTAYDMMREALAQQQSAERVEPVACTDEMCACRGGPCVSCPDGEREKELADAWDSRDFYKRRTDELQKAQSQMRDPERTMVCDILANGRLLVPAGDRYDTSPQPAQPSQRSVKPWRGLTDEEMRELEKQFNAERVRTSDEEYLIIYPSDYWAWQRAIEAKLREKKEHREKNT